MTQLAVSLAIKPNGLKSAMKTDTVKDENQLLPVLLWLICPCIGTCIHMPESTYTHIGKSKNKKN